MGELRSLPLWCLCRTRSGVGCLTMGPPSSRALTSLEMSVVLELSNPEPAPLAMVTINAVKLDKLCSEFVF